MPTGPDELSVLRAQVELLREAHELANSALRSVYQVALRDGKETNWVGIREMLQDSLQASHQALAILGTLPKRDFSPKLP